MTNHRKVIVHIARTDGDLEWLTARPAPAGFYGIDAFMQSIDTKDELYAEIKQKGAPLIEELADTPWGMREFGIRTPDGHRIMFGQEIQSL